MQGKLLEDDKATCYLVEVISSKSKDEAWAISLDGKHHSHNKIRRMSMDKFYELVFGQPDAFYRLCIALPNIIEDVVSENKEFALKNTVYRELSKKHSDMLKSLYLLAFSTYEGFNNLLVK